MKIFKLKSDLQSYLESIREEKILSFVPTMGALHLGHMSLIETAKHKSDIVICSIFVNPTQFNNPADLLKYPRNNEEDIKILEDLDCDVLYLPEVIDLYNNNEKAKAFDFNGLDKFMEGSGRRGHFDGVATIIEKLFRIVKPNIAFFGLKDLQQLQIIKHVTMQLCLPIEIIGVETKREESGLAMSSRNSLLSEQEKGKSMLISETLNFIKDNSTILSIDELMKQSIKKFKNQNVLDLEYLEIVSLNTLQPISKLGNKHTNAACIAASISSVRLIDNIIF